MRRRDFIKGIVGSSAWPLAARAQQRDRMVRVGALLPAKDDDPAARAWLSAFITAFAGLGWSEGRNLRMDVRWGAGDLDRVRMYAKELVASQPDAILVESTPQAAALQRETRTIPIVFVIVSDPVGSGFVASLARPGGNMTGFSNQDPSMGGKWVELLAEIAPHRRRVAALFNPETAPYVKTYYLPPFEVAARSLGIDPIAAPVRSDAEIETAIAPLGREMGGAVIMPDAFLSGHRTSVISLATRNNVPTISQESELTRDGLLISYGPDLGDLYRRAASYVDLTLRGAKPSDLPVQLPVKFRMAVNVKTAKALRLAVPQSILLRADEVME
jgi:putative tryptophan/tyrosine transport system substrate-binding protein